MYHLFQHSGNEEKKKKKEGKYQEWMESINGDCIVETNPTRFLQLRNNGKFLTENETPPPPFLLSIDRKEGYRGFFNILTSRIKVFACT